MNGNVTREGVKLDFEWMQRIGIVGVQNFDASFGLGTPFDTPLLVDRPLSYLTPEWQQTLRYTVEQATELGLEFTIASSAGWSESGGPWVQPHQAMKKLVWSETVVTGGTLFDGKLAKPPQTTGPFQNMPVLSLGPHGIEQAEKPVHYRDVAVVAFPLPAAETSLHSLEPRITSSWGECATQLLDDSDFTKVLSWPLQPAHASWIQFSFSKPQRIQAITAAIGHPIGATPPLNAGISGWLEVSDDGVTFRKVTEIPRNDGLPQTVSFSAVVAPIFRVVVERPEPSLVEQLGFIAPRGTHQIAQLILHTNARINRFEDKAGYSTRQIKDEHATPPVALHDLIYRKEIIDLTDRMRTDGSLKWDAPPGRWLVLRFGHSLIGRTNHPASAAGTGLEVDKLNGEHVRAYIETYLDNYEKSIGHTLIGAQGLQYMLTDSYEAGAQNWTEDLPQQFTRRRGYSLIPWLPALAGRVVDSAAASDRFLWDFRKTLSELIAEAHYGQLTAALHRRGLGRYGESHETHRAFIGDGMEAKKTADVPMGAIWAARIPGYTQEELDADVRESASVAHIYGQNLVAAESFTAFGNTYAFTPEMLKPLADRAMAMGLNRFVIHTSVHQPDSRTGPGIGLGPFGQWFTRKEVWAEMAGAWISYLSRSSYLLQQGKFVADIAYLYGDDTNLTSLFGMSAPPIPKGYDFDFVNSDALLNEFTVERGKLRTRSGMEYRLLALDVRSTKRMSVPLLRKLRDLVISGAILVGAKPVETPSLADSENEFSSIAMDLWGSSLGERTLGEGKIFSGVSLEDSLRNLQIPADIEFLTKQDSELRFLHRTLSPHGDIYFVSNASACPLSVIASFRVSGRKPELWRADSGDISPLSYRLENDRTIIPLRLEAHDAVFVVFQHPASKNSATIPEPTFEALMTIDGPWNVVFPTGLGAPPHAVFDTLLSWTEHNNDGIRYFSGVATYSKVLQVHRAWLANRARLQLDLGEVKYLAEVLLNGRSVGVLWKHPFTIEITDAVHEGQNHLEIKVANLWPNRLIGDKQSGAHRIAFATYDPFKADSALLPSGLLGPVSLLSVRN